MADRESPQARAQPQENETVFGFLVRILDEKSTIVEKDGLGLFE